MLGFFGSFSFRYQPSYLVLMLGFSQRLHNFVFVLVNSTQKKGF